MLSASIRTTPLILEVVRGILEEKRKPKHALLHLNKFNGLDRAAYLAFKGYLKVKFRIDLEAIRAKTEKV